MRLHPDGLAATATSLTGILCIFAVPSLLSDYYLAQLTLNVSLSVFALSLAYLWGYSGVLSFGHAAFFGLGGYAFAVAALNTTDAWLGVVAAMGCSAIFAAALGWFMFYGRLSDVYLSVVTLVVSLILFKVMSHTAGPEYMIGQVALGGYNGIPGLPGLHVPFAPDDVLDDKALFRLSLAILIGGYLLLKFLQRTSFGQLTVAIREHEARAALLGYNVRRHKVLVFSLCGALAGLAGAMFASHQAFVDPNALALPLSAQCLVWVIIGGRGTLIGPVLASIVLQQITTKLSEATAVDSNLLLGSLLVVAVVVLPGGLVPVFGHVLRRAVDFLRRRASASPDKVGALT
ncbi:branched-chain amino acid ABC transporter permease [Bradyrhizobium liaoningense]